MREEIAAVTTGPRGLLARTATRLRGAIGTLLRPRRSRIPRPEIRAIALSTAVIVLVLLIVAFLFDSFAITGSRSFPAWARVFFAEITDFGKGAWFLYPLGIFIILIALVPPNLPRSAQLVLDSVMARAGFLFLAIALPGLIVSILKRLIGRARPFVTGIADPYAFAPFSWKVEYASLPSGHATTAFAAVIAISVLWPRARPVMLIYAVLIAISRIVVSAHHPTDVMAGALAGALGAILVRDFFAARRIVFGVTPQGTISVFPGPSWRRIKRALRAVLAD